MTEVILARGLVKARRDSERHFEVRLPDLRVGPAENVALVGESGSGKSTILSLLALATPPDRVESFRFCGADIPAAWARDDQPALARMRAEGIAYLPQRDGLMEFLSLRDNILCSAELGHALPVQGLERIADGLGITELLAAKPAALSGGQRQRAAVACALARRPRAILADEPTAALDAGNAARVVESLCRMGADLGTALIFATHQPHLLAEHGFRLFSSVMAEGPQGPLSTFEEVA